MTDDLAIPEYLKINQADRAAAWKGRRVKTVSGQSDDAPKRNVDSTGRALPTHMSPEGWAMLREQEKAKAAKADAFFKSKVEERKAAKNDPD